MPVHKLMQSKWFEWICLGALLALFAFLYVHVNTQGTYVLQDYRQGSYYTQLALQFQHGSLGLPNFVGGDWAEYKGTYYLYHGPFPALVWLFFKTYFRELSMSFLSLAMLIVNLFLFYRLARKVASYTGIDDKKSMLMSFLFLVLYGLGIPYYLAGKMFVYETSITFGSTFLLGALLLFLSFITRAKKHDSLVKEGVQLGVVGLLISLACVSRINLLLAFVPFVAAFLWHEWKQHQMKIRDLASSWFLFSCFMLPIAIALMCFGFYNVARFGNPLDFGVNHLSTSSGDDNARLQSGKATSIHYGLLNLMQATVLLPNFDTKPSYINYTAPSWLVGTFPRLVNVEYGGSLFFSSPILLFLLIIPFFWRKLPQKLQISLIFLTGLFFFVATYSYFFMGFSRRYHQDYYPILMLFAMTGFILFWNRFVAKSPMAVQVIFGSVIFLCVVWTAAIAVHLNCIHTYYGQFDRCLDLKQPIQWFQPLS